MTKEEEVIYNKAMETYKKLPEKYTKYSIIKQKEKINKMIHSHRQFKPSTKGSTEDGFNDWREAAYKVCDQLTPHSHSSAILKLKTELEFLS